MPRQIISSGRSLKIDWRIAKRIVSEKRDSPTPEKKFSEYPTMKIKNGRFGDLESMIVKGGDMIPQLIITDDDLLLREALKVLLVKSGVVFYTFADTEKEAIRRIEELEPDLLKLDFESSRSNGMFLFAHLRKHFPNLKMIILTMHQGLLRHALSSAVIGYCFNDFEPIMLQKGVEKALNDGR